tara:strand:- start:358 stop:585 length:228 start_codon:yes stop_codon:yes gene_type:complete
MNKEITFTYGDNITLVVHGYFSGEDKTTNKPNEFELSTITYKGTDIVPLLEGLVGGFDILSNIAEDCIDKIINED